VTIIFAASQLQYAVKLTRHSWLVNSVTATLQARRHRALVSRELALLRGLMRGVLLSVLLLQLLLLLVV